MKRILVFMFAIAVLDVFSLHVYAEDSPELRVAATDRYLKVVPASKMVDDMLAEIAKQIPPERRDQFMGKIKLILRADTIERITRESMVKVFTSDEINALADFYGSKNGSSIMNKFGKYMGMIMPIMQQENSKKEEKDASKRNL
jgi:hypothetical protein